MRVNGLAAPVCLREYPCDSREEALSDQATTQQLPPPLFYKKPELLTAAAHGQLALSDKANYAFAAKAISIPLNVVEVPVARSYPIVFANVAPYIPLAVVGVRKDENLFVDAKGAWDPAAYIPAYVRRHPFVLAESGVKDQFALAIDAESTRLGKKGAPLFKDGKPTDLVHQASNFCVAFKGEADTTRSVMETIHAMGLLMPNNATITLKPGGERIGLTDFFVTDEKKLGELSDEDFLKLRRASALGILYAQMASRLAWGDLLRRMEARTKA